MRCFVRCLSVMGLGGLMLAGGCGSAANAPRWWTNVRYPHAGVETLTEYPDDHYQHRRNIFVHDAKALGEDLDAMMLADRPSRLNRWHDQ